MPNQSIKQLTCLMAYQNYGEDTMYVGACVYITQSHLHVHVHVRDRHRPSIYQTNKKHNARIACRLSASLAVSLGYYYVDRFGAKNIL